MKRSFIILLFIFNSLFTISLYSEEIERAKGPVLAKATGHYARARALIISAIEEFDKANQLVDPSALLNVEAWRRTLIDRAEDLERVLDPQPRVTNDGIRFNPDSRLLTDVK